MTENKIVVLLTLMTRRQPKISKRGRCDGCCGKGSQGCGCIHQGMVRGLLYLIW